MSDNNGAISLTMEDPDRCELVSTGDVELMEEGKSNVVSFLVPAEKTASHVFRKLDSSFPEIERLESTAENEESVYNLVKNDSAFLGVGDEGITVERIDTSAKMIFETHVQALGRQLFEYWDVDGDGFIGDEEIGHGDSFDKEFAEGFARCLDHDQSGKIHLEDVINVLKALKMGSMGDKVQIVMRFMDRGRDNKITYEEAEFYLKAAPKDICRRMGFINSDGTYKDLEYKDLLRLFEESDRGEDALGIFCGHILNVLESRNKTLLKHKSRISYMGSIYNIAQQESCGGTLTNLINRTPKSTMFLVVLVLIQMGLWVYNFMHYWKRGFPPAFCFAKGCGLNLRILTIFLFLSMARSTMGYIYEMAIVRAFVPMGFNIQIHSFIGFSTVVHAFGHMCGHIAFHTDHVDGGFMHAFTQHSLLRGASWKEHGKGDAITGFILLAALLLMAWTALNRGGSAEKYKQFAYTHYLYNIWIIFIFLHVPHLWPFFVFIGGIMLFERSYDFFLHTNHSTLATSRQCGDGVTFFSVPRAGDPTYPGAYYRIKVPSISATEWHPFSLAGSMSSHMLTFFIASVGDWTKELYDVVGDPEMRNKTKVMVQGPFYAPAHSAIKNPTASTLLVASGIGITPFFSIMATKVTDEQSYETDRDVFESLFSEELEDQRHLGPAGTFAAALQVGRNLVGSSKPAIDKKDIHRMRSRRDSWAEVIGEIESPVKILRVVWTIREVSDLMFYVDYVCELVKHQQALQKPVLHVDIYLTGLGKGSDLKFMMSQTLFLLTVAKRTSGFMKIHFGRPDMDRIMRNIKPDQVYYCGGKFLKDTLADICTKYNVHFHPEDFDSGAQLLPKAIKKIKGFFNFKPTGIKK